MLESFMEDLLWKYPDDFFPGRGFKPVARQFTLSGAGRLDISFRDNLERLWVIEVKAVPIRTVVADQVYRYAQSLREAHPNDRPFPAVVAPVINATVREHFDRWGIEYYEITEATFRRVATERGIEMETVEPNSTTTSASTMAKAANALKTAAGDGPEETVAQDLQRRIRDLLVSLIEREPEIAKETTETRRIRFHVRAWDETDLVRGTWAETGHRILSFTFANDVNDLALNLWIHPGPEEIRERLKRHAKRTHPFRVVEQKPSTRIWRKRFLGKASRGLSWETIQAELTVSWTNFLKGDLPMIQRALEPVMIAR